MNHTPQFIHPLPLNPIEPGTLHNCKQRFPSPWHTRSLTLKSLSYTEVSHNLTRLLVTLEPWSQISNQAINP